MNVDGAPQRIVTADEAFPRMGCGAPSRAPHLLGPGCLERGTLGCPAMRALGHAYTPGLGHDPGNRPRSRATRAAPTSSTASWKARSARRPAVRLVLLLNRVDDAAARQVIAAAEKGQIALPEHDYGSRRPGRRIPLGSEHRHFVFMRLGAQAAWGHKLRLADEHVNTRRVARPPTSVS